MSASVPTPPLGEFELIAALFAPMAGEGAFNLRDDAAVFAPTPGCQLVVTKDMLVEGRHYRPEDPPESLARKALRVNVSDLAAKGATPRGFLLGLGRSEAMSDAWLSAFATALAEDARAFGCPLLGGDTVGTPHAFLSITAFGEMPEGAFIRREGGAAGDALYVTGTIGDSALGLALLSAPDSALALALAGEHRDFLIDRFLHPVPRLALGPALRAYASAAMDISDGLVGDSLKLAPACGHAMHLADVPLSPAARAALAQDPRVWTKLYTGGDDYEILCAIPPQHEPDFCALAAKAGVAVTRIGVLTPGTPQEFPQEVSKGASKDVPKEVSKEFIAPSGAPVAFPQPSFRHF